MLQTPQRFLKQLVILKCIVSVLQQIISTFFFFGTVCELPKTDS
jgi:hypothetical protein